MKESTDKLNQTVSTIVVPPVFNQMVHILYVDSQAEILSCSLIFATKIVVMLLDTLACVLFLCISVEACCFRSLSPPWQIDNS